MVTAVITGASSGLGKEYINAIINQYPSVDAFWLVARRKELLKEIAQEHPDKTIAAISLDLGEEESLEIFEKLLKENQPEIKVLVNNAGYGKCTDFFTSNRESQTGMVDLNCRALTGITRLCLPYMLDDSLVLNIASIAGLAPSPGIGWYGATKALVMRLTQELAVEVGPAVRVNAIAPGVIKTRFAEALYEGREESMAAALPTRRLGVPDDIAGPTAFLLSDDAHWMTGQTLVVDGGAHIVGAGLQG